MQTNKEFVDYLTNEEIYGIIK